MASTQPFASDCDSGHPAFRSELFRFLRTARAQYLESAFHEPRICGACPECWSHVTVRIGSAHVPHARFTAAVSQLAAHAKPIHGLAYADPRIFEVVLDLAGGVSSHVDHDHWGRPCRVAIAEVAGIEVRAREVHPEERIWP
jgi:hypothetical protein